MTQDVLDTMIGYREAATDPEAAEAHYQAALAAESNGDREVVVEELRKAVQQGDSPLYEFKLAFILDLVGEEEEAVALYEQACSREMV